MVTALLGFLTPTCPFRHLAITASVIICSVRYFVEFLVGHGFCIARTTVRTRRLINFHLQDNSCSLVSGDTISERSRGLALA